MTELTDDLLRRWLAERGAGTVVSLAAVARSVSARPQGRPFPVLPASFVGVAVAVLIATILAIGPLARVTHPGTSGEASPSGPPSAGGSAATGGSPGASSAAEEPSPLRPTIIGCEGLFPATRCRVIVQRALDQIAGAHDPVAVRVEPPKRDTTSLGSWAIAHVVVTYGDGAVKATDLRCMLTPGSRTSDRACRADAEVWLADGVSHDVPCGPTPGDDTHPCVPPPTPRPASIAASEPLILRTVDVPIDHLGHYEVEVGAASVPDGAISERSGTVGDPHPTGFWIDPYVELEVRSDIPGRPIADGYNRERYDGPEPVHVFLVFDVTELTDPGSILEIRNLIVR